MLFKAKTFNPKMHIAPKFAQLKFDGNRTFIDDDGVFTSNFIDITDKVREYRWYDLLLDRRDAGSTIEFELCSVGHPAEHVKTALKHHLPTKIYPFATDFLRHDASLDDLQLYFKDSGLEHPLFWLTKGLTLADSVSIARKHKVEGLVLKNGNYKDWYKVKEVKTIDLIVSGTKDGKGKFIGLVGSLVCETTEGQEICSTSGMDLATRISIDEADVLGRIVEVAYDRVCTNGRLRFPRFVRWRDDKDKDGCSISQDPELVELWDDE